jgi:hypothetical protein
MEKASEILSLLLSPFPDKHITLRYMKQFVILLVFAVMAGSYANAQTYLEHLQRKQATGGTVTVNQSKEIDELVNNVKLVGTAHTTHSSAKTQISKTGEQHTTEQQHTAAHEKTSSQQQTAEKPHQQKQDTATKNGSEGEFDIPTVDMRKKVMRKSYRVSGYRVQAYSGDNSRAARQKAEGIGNTIKMKYPDQPIYVHFYSPRWICRVGNYRSYEEANQMLKNIRAMGYRQACIVKGQITVQY